MPPCRTRAKTGQARMGGICGGTAVFEGNTNYGKVEARGGGKGASEFSIGGISGMIAHDATGCRNFGDVLNNTGRENLLAHTGGLFGWATLAFTITDCALDADVVSTTLYNYDGDKGTTADPHTRTAAARAFWSDAQVEDRGNGRIGEDLRQADADDKRRGADQDDRFHDDGAGRQLSLRCVAGCGFQIDRRAGSDHLRFDCEVIRKYANGGLRFPILF